MCTVRQHLLHLGQKVNERQKERRKRERAGNHEKNAMYCNLQCFSFFIVKTVVYCIVLKKKKVHKFPKIRGRKKIFSL